MSRLHLRRFLLSACILTLLLGANTQWLSAAPNQSTPVAVRLSEKGKALHPVVISTSADDTTKAAAGALAENLKRISGGEFEVEIGDGMTGLAVGTAAHFPALALQKNFESKEATRQQDYILRSHKDGAYLIGATPEATEFAVWDFLYRLGYRQFFPGAHWEVVPKTPSLSIAVDEKEQPDYYLRSLWFTYGTWPDNKLRVAQWGKKNRMGGLGVNFGHAYGGIIARNKAEFDKHPEYFSERDGKRMVGPQGKLDISNPGLRQLVIDDALRHFEQHPDSPSYSVDPSDGFVWGNSAAEQALGSVSDRVTFLANEVAEAVSKKYPDKIISYYAYNAHSAPPSIKVHPNVAVAVATAFIRGGHKLDDLIIGWQRQGATIGIREYLSIIHWDRDLPNIPRASAMGYITRIADFHKKGARYMSAEASDNWGPAGLGYYLTSRILWDADEAKRLDELVDDFLEKSFGPAKGPMTDYYGMINRGLKFTRPHSTLNDDTMGRMFRALEKARASTDDPAILARINDLVLYTRYLQLFRTFLGAPKDEKLNTFADVIRHSYRIHDTHMVHSQAQYRTGFRMVSKSLYPEGASWLGPEETNPWKSSEPFSEDEIREFVRDGLEKNPLRPFDTVEFSKDLVPATPLKLENREPVGLTDQKVDQDYYTWLPKGGGSVTLTIATGINKRRPRGPGSLALYKVDTEPALETALPAEDDEEDAVVAPPAAPVPLESVEIEPRTGYHTITLKSPHGGLHRIRMVSQGIGSRVKWESLPLVAEVSLDNNLGLEGTAYFYVPKGTKVVGVAASGTGQVVNSSGKVMLDMMTPDAKRGYLALPVDPGEDGKVWKFEKAVGRLILMTVPPYVARNPAEMLLPREVVEADATP